MQAQTTQGPQNHAAFRKSYSHHNPIMLTADQTADLAVLAAWNSISDEMAQALPTTPPYRKPLVLLQCALHRLAPMQTAAPITLAECWTPIIPALDIPSLPPVAQACDKLSLVETQIDIRNGGAVSPSSKANLIDGWLEGRASWGEVKAAHKPKATFTQHLVRRAYAVLTFVGGYARLH